MKHDMTFARKPENDFPSFIQTYYDECRKRFDGIEAIAGKWMFRDLIPGMSDFDARFICRDGMTADGWCEMGDAVGEAHLDICRKYACWARMLEHTPGINLTWDELTSERHYYPEFGMWTFYHTTRPDKLTAAQDYLKNRSWGIKDEYFHLKKFCLYYGRYDRQIDPGCNLFPHANKYPLHSRLMHYFTPPVQSAVCILEKRNIAGKFDSLEIAERLLPDLRCWAAIRQILHADYALPSWMEEPGLTTLEDYLAEALAAIAAKLREVITLVPAEAGVNISAWKEALNRVQIDPAMAIFEGIKFCRLMKGRLRFYARSPWHFEHQWCIENELKRIGNNFFKLPFGMYWRLRSGESVDDPLSILDNLKGDLLTEDEIAAVRQFVRLTPGTWKKGNECESALAIAEVFDDFFKALYKISDDAMRLSALT